MEVHKPLTHKLEQKKNVNTGKLDSAKLATKLASSCGPNRKQAAAQKTSESGVWEHG